jgi:hypothetical protein
MAIAFWFCIIIQLSMGGGMIYYLAMIRSLQLAIHLCCLNIMVPANALYFMSSLFQITAWNVFEIDSSSSWKVDQG